MVLDSIRKAERQIRDDVSNGLLFLTKKYFGFIVTVVIVILQMFTPILKLSINDNYSLFCLVIVFTIFVGGTIPGVASYAIAIMHIFFSNNNIIASSLFVDNVYEDHRIAMSSLIIIPILAIIIDKKYRIYHNECITKELYKKRIEEEVEILKKEAEENLQLIKEAMESDKLKNEFFANVSHELRTPLNVIMGVLHLLTLYNGEDGISHESCLKYIKMMKQNCYRLLRLINNLIDITKIDAGFFDIKLGKYDIVKIIEDITLSIADYIESNGLTLEFDTDIEEKVIACDPNQMERIILNLLANSIKFTNPGGKINVIMEAKRDPVKVIIKDTGIGIPEDQIESIFERFRQVKHSFSRECEGSGIGLSLVKALIEMHGGSINVSSEKDKGTEFIISIPSNEDKVITEEGRSIKNEGNIDRIRVEFSDIYSD